VRPQMKTVPGVAGADAIGGFVKQYQVQPDPQNLVAYGLSFQQVIAAIHRTGALDYTRRQAEFEARTASAALAGLPDTKQRDYLLQLANFAVTRDY